MKAGVIGVIEDDFDAISSFEVNSKQGDQELTRCVEIRQTIRRENIEVQVGRAATQELTEQEEVQIREGSVVVSNRTKPNTKYTEFLLVPGEFIAVSNGGGAFAFDLIGSQESSQISRAKIDLQGLWEQSNKVSPWKAGFYAHQGNAETGVIYGEDVLKDDDFGNGIDEAQLNQLGLDYSPEDDAIKMTATESGYVEIYQPENYDEIDYAKYVRSEILPHVSTQE